MYRTAVLIGIMIFLSSGCANRQADVPGQVDVTYIANEGFLLASGEKKVLIDALFVFDSLSPYPAPSDSLLQLMIDARPPFDGVDLVLITHWHRDHVALTPLIPYLLTNRDIIVVCPPQVDSLLKESFPAYAENKKRIIAIEPDSGQWIEETYNGIDAMTLGLWHSPYWEMDETTGKGRNLHATTQNWGYIVTLGGLKILHVGDARKTNHEDCFRRLHDEGIKIDLAFSEYFDYGEESQNIITKYIQPRDMVFMHFPTDTAARDRAAKSLLYLYPTTHIFITPLETRRYEYPE